MIILDTNVLSEPLRPRPDAHVLRWLDRQAPDTLHVTTGRARSNDHERQRAIVAAAAERCINLRLFEDGALGIALDETTSIDDLKNLFEIFAGRPDHDFDGAFHGFRLLG